MKKRPVEGSSKDQLVAAAPSLGDVADVLSARELFPSETTAAVFRAFMSVIGNHTESWHRASPMAGAILING